MDQYYVREAVFGYLTIKALLRYSMTSKTARSYLATQEARLKKYEPYKYRSDSRRTLDAACDYADLEVVQWVVEKFRIDADHIKSNKCALFRNLVIKGRKDKAMWIADKFEITSSEDRSMEFEALFFVAGTGDLDMVKWLVERFQLSEDVVKGKSCLVLINAAKHGHLETLKWLTVTFNFTPEDLKPLWGSTSNDVLGALLESARFGRLRVLQWFCETFKLTADIIRTGGNCVLHTTAAQGHLEQLKWLIARFDLTLDDVRCSDHHALLGAITFNKLEVARWLTERFNLTTEGRHLYRPALITAAAQSGSLEVLEWVVGTYKCLTTEHAKQSQAIMKTAVAGHFESARWIIEKFNLTKGDALAHGAILVSSAAKNGNLEFLQWITEKFGLTTKDIRGSLARIFSYAAKEGHLDVPKWLVKHFKRTGATQSVIGKATRGAISHGQYETATWLVETFGPTREEILDGKEEGLVDYIVRGGSQDLGDYLIEKFELTADDARVGDYEALRRAVCNDDFEIVRWLVVVFKLSAEDINKSGVLDISTDEMAAFISRIQ